MSENVVRTDNSNVLYDNEKMTLGNGGDITLSHDGTDSHITNKTGTLNIATATSAVPISIGHTTSETTVNDNLTVTGNLTSSAGLNIGQSVTVISVATAADASHTLAASNSGTVFVTAALANGAVIKLPAADTAGVVGSYFRIVMVTSPAAGAAISLPNGGTGEFIGVILLTSQKGQDGANEKVPVAGAASDNYQKIILDENAKEVGGAAGSVYEIYYKSTTEVLVYGNVLHTEDGTTAPTGIFNATGY